MLYNIVMKPETGTLPPSRARLAAVLRAARETVSIDIAAQALGTDRHRAAKTLSQWASQGWLRRIGPGLYVPVPLDLAGNEQVIAHHWELTEQLFNETVVFTTRRVVKKRATAQGAVFVLHNIPARRLFGLKTLWRGSAKVAVSDPARTLVDILAMPETGGGIDHVAECVENYLHGKTADRDLLIRYTEQFGNGAVFKRLGFLADTRFHHRALAEACRERLTQGYALLDPALPRSHLITAWRVWVPAHWKDKAP
jgi:predicted transcriptional regulator of viral defense system